MKSDDKNFLVGKKVMITGGASGIGKSCVIAFVEAGADVLAVDSNPLTLAALAAEFKVATKVADLSTPEKYFPDLLEIDILINNA